MVSVLKTKRAGSHTLKFGATEVLQNLLPVWRVIVATQVGLELATENLQRRALANTVCANKSQDLTRPGHGQPVELEAVGRVSMGDLGLEVGGQIDDVDGVKGAFLRADTATDTEALGDEGDFGRVGDFDAQLARADNGTRLFAFLTAFLRLLAGDQQIEEEELALGLHYGSEHALVSIVKFVWRGSGAYTLSELTMAILQKLVWVSIWVIRMNETYRVSLSDMFAAVQVVKRWSKARRWIAGNFGVVSAWGVLQQQYSTRMGRDTGSKAAVTGQGRLSHTSRRAAQSRVSVAEI